MPHSEAHRTASSGWLRAAVLGANDGIVSTASLVVGVASAAANRQEIRLAGVAGVAAGAFSMAAGASVLLALAGRFAFFPRVLAYPAGVLLTWIALALLYHTFRLQR